MFFIHRLTLNLSRLPEAEFAHWRSISNLEDADTRGGARNSLPGYIVLRRSSTIAALLAVLRNGSDLAFGPPGVVVNDGPAGMDCRQAFARGVHRSVAALLHQAHLVDFQRGPDLGDDESLQFFVDNYDGCERASLQTSTPATRSKRHAHHVDLCNYPACRSEDRFPTGHSFREA